MRRTAVLRTLVALGGLAALAACSERPTEPTAAPELAASSSSRGMIGINVLTRTAPTQAMLDQLGKYAKVFDVLPEIKAVILLGKADQLPAIRALSFVTSAEPDGEVGVDPSEAGETIPSFAGGMSVWNLDAINVTSGPGAAKRAVEYTGRGVYVGVIDSGLLSSWRSYFLPQRIATQYATSFVGGGAAAQGATPTPPDWWERDQNSHGNHVTSTILGFNLVGAPTTQVTGVAPEATVIPVKVLNQSGRGWWSGIAQGLVHITRLKRGPLAGSPVVVNISIGGSPFFPIASIMQAAVDDAIAAGVVVVAAAGNSGTLGMTAPGSYAPLIGVASVGWSRQYRSPNWWFAVDFPEREDLTAQVEFFVSGSSGREKPGQDLDVAAPGVSILGPAQTNSGHLQYQFYTGTSMATPHVVGTVALMLQKNPTLTTSQVEGILEGHSLALPRVETPACPIILPGFWLAPVERCWDDDATGGGILQADLALAATPAPPPATAAR
ncbi:MAG TPA: S8 family serine peptidase [Gemmatimonadaceae bacterium]|nr:S8 family serine peptidase [Gemmatimonadaceae bacterium]